MGKVIFDTGYVCREASFQPGYMSNGISYRDEVGPVSLETGN